MEKKKNSALKRIKDEITKIDKKKNNVYFFILDTKGNPSGSLEYIYKLAKFTKDEGYNVGMLYQTLGKDDKFVGVGDWLSEDYSSLPHYDIGNDDVEISPSDILFIPEIFANVMNQTKKLPCKRIAILQNYDYLVEQMPFAGQWGDFGIMEAITNTEHNANLLKDIFPYVKTTVVEPYIDNVFGSTIAPKNLVVNIVAANQDDINRIVKPFYWKFPSFKWVSFNDVRGFTKEQFAQTLREGAITVWVDDRTSFGYSALEAIKSGSIVIAKIPNEPLKWMNSDDKDEIGKLRNSCVWFNDFHEVHKAIASVVRSFITDKVPDELANEAEKVNKLYSEENTKKTFIDYLNGVIINRKNEMTELLNAVENNNVEKKETTDE